LHRWYADERIPDGLAVLVGLSGVALLLKTAYALDDIVVGRGELLTPEAALFNFVSSSPGSRPGSAAASATTSGWNCSRWRAAGRSSRTSAASSAPSAA
jgi:hypothetical protein